MNDLKKIAGLVETLPMGILPERGLLESIFETIMLGDDSERFRLLAGIRTRASAVRQSVKGDGVWYRGLLEFSNKCARNCLYCGIRAGNRQVKRYSLDIDDIVAVAQWCADAGYGSMTLQSGERDDNAFYCFIEEAVAAIRSATSRPVLPEGLGITVCCGELPDTVLEKLRTAGARRYLLRVETSDPGLYARLHPARDGGLDRRIAALRRLRGYGYRVGTGVMIGLPGQTASMLAGDLEFFFNENVHMVGMGPYIPHSGTPLAMGIARAQAPEAATPATAACNKHAQGGAGGPVRGQTVTRQPIIPAIPSARIRLELSLAMIGMLRIVMPGINIASTTALQAIHPFGRELGLDYGANILMPLVTPAKVRGDYLLYDGKPCVDEETEECRDCLALRVGRSKRSVVYNDYGDSGGGTA